MTAIELAGGRRRAP